jgi:hypothetical protein
MNEKSQQKKAKKFLEEYGELCKKYGCAISVNPVLKNTKDGMWGVSLQTSVSKLPKLTIKNN